MDSNKVQWLQKMGIDVWRSRTSNNAPPQQDYSDSKSTELTDVLDHSPKLEEAETKTRLGASETKSAVTTKTSISDGVQQTNIDVYCCLNVGLLLIKDNSALDRDFAEDIFRAHKLLVDRIQEKTEITFFRFVWPSVNEFRYMKDANDVSVDGARRAFLAKTKSIESEVPVLIVSIGKGAIQLSNIRIFGDARVLQWLDDPYSGSFKKTLWNFLRNVQ